MKSNVELDRLVADVKAIAGKQADKGRVEIYLATVEKTDGVSDAGHVCR